MATFSIEQKKANDDGLKIFFFSGVSGAGVRSWRGKFNLEIQLNIFEKPFHQLNTTL